MSKGTWFRTLSVKDWSELSSRLAGYCVDGASNDGSTNWVLRGVANTQYGLLTSLERELAGNPYFEAKPAKAERLLLQEYKRRAHHYTRAVSRETTDAEWLAQMQHYGAPTRLLDWTYSPYVALFFAIQGARRTSAVPGLWVLNLENVLRFAKRRAQAKLRSKTEPHESELFDISQAHPFDAVFPLDLGLANERLSIQQGLLLCPGNIEKTFDENLRKSVGMDDMLQIQIDRELILDITLQLHMMNINHATVFPGIDGFSASMRELLWSPEFIRKVQHT